jgi:hypothetical protein
MRVSGERQRNRRNASPENLASAMKAGSPARNSTATAQGENCQSSTAKLAIAIAFCTSPKLRMTSDSGRVEASRRARVSLS